MEIWPGRPAPLGATPEESGTNFAVASEIAQRVVLCLFDEAGAETRLPLPVFDDGVWHGFVRGVGVGQRYGYRVIGPHDPARGLRCNLAKLLLDPYAKATDGELVWGESLFGYPPGDPDGRSGVDSAPYMLRSLVADPSFAWDADRQPGTPYRDTVIYELHVKGFTQTRRDVPPALRGTYAGLAHPPVVEYLAGLGVTAVELLPIHQFVASGHLAERGRGDYWGYNSIGFFAPHDRYSAAVRAGRPGGQIAEFQAMVKALHAAGLEVLLDVVFNHTGEGSHLGPTLCFRGLDNPSYYRLLPGDLRRYVDTTGTGNSVNADHPTSLRMITDSLRYWVSEMHVDGFRFDLATTLAREQGDFDFDQLATFFYIVAQDPVISQIKLIAEPWDVGQPDSYSVGRFPALWREWNGRYRDTVRDFWRGADGILPDLATRIAGSSDLYAADRRPTSSVNFVTAHDGFTLRDLVSYERKHNEDNGEDNRDGTDDNRSWNCGVEGPADDPEILALRARQSRALLGTLLLSRGVPMILGGDEIGRTQSGNNNAYCQDNPTSWFDWDTTDAGLAAYTRKLIAIRRAHPALRRGASLADPGYHVWFTPAGRAMTDADWLAPGGKAIAVYVDGTVAPDLDVRGQPMLDDDLLTLVNGSPQPVTFTVPDVGKRRFWQVEVDSFDLGADTAESHTASATGAPGGAGTVLEGKPAGAPDAAGILAGSLLTVRPRSFVLLLARRRRLSLPSVMRRPDYPIKTARLILRPYTSGDFDDLYDIQSRPDVTRYVPFSVRDRDQVRTALEQKIAASTLDAEGGNLTLAVVLPQTGTMIGDVMLFWHSREHRQGEIGYIFHPDHGGKGYATEAAEVLLRLGFEDLGLHRITGRIDARNTASARVLQRLGMRKEAHFIQNEFVKGEWTDEIVYAILEHDWRARQP